MASGSTGEHGVELTSSGVVAVEDMFVKNEEEEESVTNEDHD